MKSTGKVTFVSQWFAPEPTIIPDQIARSFVDAGFDLTVLTGIPNYPTGVVQEGYRAHRASREAADGFTVRRTPLYASHDRSSLRRIANYVSWAISSTAMGFREMRDRDVVVVYGSPITASLPAMVAKIFRGIPFVLIVQDVWPDSVFATGFLQGRGTRVVHGALSAFCNLAYRWAGRVVVISPGMRSLLVDRGVPVEKIEVIYNWHPALDVEEAAISLRSLVGAADDDFVLLYAGNHGPAQALDSLVAAVAKVRRDARVRLVLVGDGVQKRDLERLATNVGADHVHFIDPQTPETIRAWATEAQAQVVALAHDPLFSVTIPSKLQAAMAVGSPVLVVGTGDLATIVDTAGCGEIAPPDDVEAIAEAVERLVAKSQDELEVLGAAAVSYYSTHMAREVGQRRYSMTVRALMKEN